MKSLVILGNGFDLACGLKTSFYDFYKSQENAFFFGHRFISKGNFFLFLLYETFFSTDEERAAFQKILNIQSHENWMDVELLLNHFVLGKAFQIAETEYFRRGEMNYTLDTVSRQFREYFHGHETKYPNFEFFVQKELYEFEEILKEYIKKEANKNSVVSMNKSVLLQKIVGISSSFRVMTFNYTSPSDNVPQNHINYVHGSLNDEIIVGIEFLDAQIEGAYSKNGTIISDKTLFTKTRKKLLHVAVDEKNNNVLNKDIERLIFYGHSLGEQDYSYFQSLFDFYDIYSGNIVLEFCYSEYNPQSYAYEVDKLTTRVFNLINKYGETLDNKNHGKNLLHKMLLENRLIFRKIDLL